MRFRRGCRGLWLAALAFGLDRLSKALALRTSDVFPLVPGLLDCRLTRNTGMAFSLLSDRPWLLIAVTAALLIGLTAYLLMRPEESPLTRVGFWLVVGGGLSNLWDRLAYGYVIDFIEPVFVRFAIFNVADVFVCLGAGMAMIGLLLTEKLKIEN